MHTLLTTSDAGASALGLLLLGLAALAALAYVVLFVAALISIVCSAHTAGMKLAWLVFAFVAPFLGSALWFLVGRRDAERQVLAAR
ncbi:PLDc_N domain-containing protein [Saccharopolyspora sp. HNM0983]|uniref:PLDc_N domain-containing protein n=1 Tax=Saccharopolyspora montiporae TaxID=2781240 RepID=A0A929G1F8_9PSEU|nr:PLD nuclease N-terminal domain-containing protein [Saccharopolyspora sp. HNM0983]MBE9376625.1 PLDc_N domain-containing protein [Saccharopolyspora sp. HNM0983]